MTLLLGITRLVVTNPLKICHRSIFGRSKIGCRDVVGYGVNGSYNYIDSPAFPFPAVRFKENTRDVMCLRAKECGDWRMLCREEKKALYRASFCQTFAEFQYPTGTWKLVLGGVLFGVSFVFWIALFNKMFVYADRPGSFSEESRQAQLRRMLDLRVNPIDGISSKWDYDLETWKKKEWF